MAIPIIDDPNRGGGSLAGSLATGLGRGLTRIATNKANELHERNAYREQRNRQQQEQGELSKRLQGLDPAITPQIADYIVTLPQAQQLGVLQMLGQGAQPQQAQGQEQEMEPMGTGLGGQPAAQSAQAPSFLQAISRGGGGVSGFDRKEQRAEEKHQWEREKQNLAEYEKLEPFLKGQAEDFKNAKLLYKTAAEMKKNLEENKNKWPATSGYLPSGFFRDKDIRKYIADSNKLVLLQAGARKGQPTNFKVKLEQLTKPELSQPYETQLELLNAYLNDAQEVFGSQRQIEQIKAENNGRYPRDLSQRLIESQLSGLGGGDQGPQEPQAPSQNTNQAAAPQNQQGNSPQQNESPEQSWIGDIVETLGGVGAETARATAAPLASLGSFAAGLPAIPGQLALGALGYLTGGKTPSYEDLQKSSPIPLPKTGAQIREKIDKATSGLTKSQSEAEQLREDILADTALSLLVPAYGVGKAATTGLKVAGALFRATGGNMASLAAETMGAGPLGQTGAKMLGMALASSAGGRAALRKQMNANYKAADIAQGTDSTSAKPLSQNISKMANEVERSDIPGKAFIQERLQAVDKAIVNDRIPVADARQLKVDMGKWRNSRETPREAQPYIKRIGKDLKETLDGYGKTNPDFGKNFKAAEDLFAGLGSEWKLAEFTKKFASDNPDSWKNIGSATAKTLLTAGLVGGSALTKGAATGIGTGVGLLGAREAYKAISLLAKSPQARQYYKEAAAAAFKDDKAAFIKSATKLDQIARKEDTKD